MGRLIVGRVIVGRVNGYRHIYISIYHLFFNSQFPLFCIAGSCTVQLKELKCQQCSLGKHAMWQSQLV